MRFLDDDLDAAGRARSTDLTYDDVFLVPRRSTVASRFDVDLATSDGTGATVPLVAANMTSVAGRRMAETLARRGALTVLPQDVAPEAVAEIIGWIKSRHPVWDTPLTLHTGDAVADALNLLPKRAHGTVAVVDEGGRPVGTVSEQACLGVDRFTRLADVLDPTPLTLPLDTPPREVFEALDGRRAALGLDDEGRVTGLLTALGAIRAGIYDPALDDDGRLRTAAAIGINGDVAVKAKALLDAGVDTLVVDTAHGHQDKMLDALRAVRRVVADGGSTGAGRGGQRGDRRGRRRPGGGGRGHRQGRGRPGRDVHDADDDRRRAAAVLRGRRVRRGGARARRRSCGPTAACGTRATWHWRWPRARRR